MWGGEGHCFREPTIRFAGNKAEGFLGTAVAAAGDGLIVVSQFRERGFLWRCVERFERSDRLQAADCFRLERQRWDEVGAGTFAGALDRCVRISRSGLRDRSAFVAPNGNPRAL
jgi:hypothetical protein